MLLLQRRLLLQPRPFISISRQFRIFTPLHNAQFDQLTKSKQSSNAPQFTKQEAKYNKIIDKLPGPFKKYGQRLANSPMSHVVSFLTIHEISAVVPFLGLWYAFHKLGFMPTDLPSWVIIKGTGFIERILGEGIQEWAIQDRTRVILEGATAYGIVKALFPVRVVFSILLTPWFARVVIEPALNLMKRGANKITGGGRKPETSNDLGELSPELKTKKIEKIEKK